MEAVAIGIFCVALIVCVLQNLSILYAMGIGLLVFGAYGRLRGYHLRQLGEMVWTGIQTAKGVLIVFLLIGALTALWRACGTIPAIIGYATALIRPKTLILMSFLLNCGMSMLTGTAFGTAATMGVICMTIGRSIGADPAILGGATLSGIYFGDRCSPVSTSALLISELTHTSIFENIKRMLATGWVPLLLTGILYTVIGLGTTGRGEISSLQQIFSRELALPWVVTLPALVLLLLSILRVRVKVTMLVSIGTAAVLSLVVQQTDPFHLLRTVVMGYTAADPEVGVLLNGGGIFSMVQVMVIVLLSSAYAGIFQKTGLLDRLKDRLGMLSRSLTPFGSVLLASVISAMVACNQTLTIMLTHQLCGGIEPDTKQFAVELENSAVLVAPLVPWSIASAVPLASIGAPSSSVLMAFFCMGLPLYYLALQLARRRRPKAGSKVGPVAG